MFKKKIIHHCYIPILTLLFSCEFVNGQTVFPVNSGDALNKLFAREIVYYQDSLTKYIRQVGTIYFKFKIGRDSLPQDISSSERHPSLLVQAVTKILKKAQFQLSSENLMSNMTYVMPLEYYYIPDMRSPQTLEDLEKQTLHIDLENWRDYINLNFNSFFDEKKSGSDLWGISCVILPPVRIKKPVSFD